MSEDELPLKLEGLNVDAVYENFVYQIAGDSLQAGDNESLQDVVERDEKNKESQKTDWSAASKNPKGKAVECPDETEQGIEIAEKRIGGNVMANKNVEKSSAVLPENLNRMI